MYASTTSMSHAPHVSSEGSSSFLPLPSKVDLRNHEGLRQRQLHICFALAHVGRTRACVEVPPAAHAQCSCSAFLQGILEILRHGTRRCRRVLTSATPARVLTRGCSARILWLLNMCFK